MSIAVTPLSHAAAPSFTPSELQNYHEVKKVMEGGRSSTPVTQAKLQDFNKVDQAISQPIPKRKKMTWRESLDKRNREKALEDGINSINRHFAHKDAKDKVKKWPHPVFVNSIVSQRAPTANLFHCNKGCCAALDQVNKESLLLKGMEPCLECFK